MKDNKVLSAIYGIALFVALIGVIGLLYNAIEMLTYTSYYGGDGTNQAYFIEEAFNDFQKPVAVALLVASLIGIIGVGAGVCYLFVKKPLFKIVCLSCVAVTVVCALAVLIATYSIWNSYYKSLYYGKIWTELGHNNPRPIYEGNLEFSIYSTVLSALIQNLVCFVVIAAALVYDFVKGILNKKKDNKTEEVVVGEITE